MRTLIIYIYMALFHPVLFLKYTIRIKSKHFLCVGLSQSIRSKNMVIGKKCRFGNYTRINFYSNGILSIGNNCYFGQRNSFLVGGNITISDDVLMASDILITSENHSLDPTIELSYGKQQLINSPVFIGEGCWIGEKVIILPGVSIGKKAIIGAGSIVTRDVPDYCIAVGNPAKVIKRFDFDKKEWIKV